jgi:protein-tyrosine phosphatase
MKILMVCLGNICRSPLAEGIMKTKVAQNDLPWQVESAGTGSWHIGELPDPRSIQIAREYGINITDQRARQIQQSDLDHFDLIIAMDSSNYNDILRLSNNPDHGENVKMIMNFVQPGYNQNVPDPYWDDDGFEKVFQMLDKACDKIIESMQSK